MGFAKIIAIDFKDGERKYERNFLSQKIHHECEVMNGGKF